MASVSVFFTDPVTPLTTSIVFCTMLACSVSSSRIGSADEEVSASSGETTSGTSPLELAAPSNVSKDPSSNVKEIDSDSAGSSSVGRVNVTTSSDVSFTSNERSGENVTSLLSIGVFSSSDSPACPVASVSTDSGVTVSVSTEISSPVEASRVNASAGALGARTVNTVNILIATRENDPIIGSSYK